MQTPSAVRLADPTSLPGPVSMGGICVGNVLEKLRANEKSTIEGHVQFVDPHLEFGGNLLHEFVRIRIVFRFVDEFARRQLGAFNYGVDFAKCALEVAIGNESEIGRHPWFPELALLAIALHRCASV